MLAQPTLLSADEQIVVVDKPSGWVVHPVGPDSKAPDLLTWLGTQDVPGRLDPAHRLDLGTSGVVVFASPDVIRRATGWFAKGKVVKHYQALVFGKTRAKGIIRRALQDGRRGAKLDAVTRYRTVETFAKKCSLLAVEPETGRKHQIRRHMQGIGHALVGDNRYGPRGKPTVPAFPGRLWLHAGEIELPDGRSFDAPLPKELEDHLAVLREKYPAPAKPSP